jgi:hypothetical protein
MRLRKRANIFINRVIVCIVLWMSIGQFRRDLSKEWRK